MALLKSQFHQAGWNQKLEGISLHSPMGMFHFQWVCLCVFYLIALFYGKQPEVEEIVLTHFLPALVE